MIVSSLVFFGQGHSCLVEEVFYKTENKEQETYAPFTPTVKHVEMLLSLTTFLASILDVF